MTCCACRQILPSVTCLQSQCLSCLVVKTAPLTRSHWHSCQDVLAVVQAAARCLKVRITRGLAQAHLDQEQGLLGGHLPWPSLGAPPTCRSLRPLLGARALQVCSLAGRCRLPATERIMRQLWMLCSTLPCISLPCQEASWCCCYAPHIDGAAVLHLQVCAWLLASRLGYSL